MHAHTHTPCNALLSQHRPNLICKRRERSLDLREGEGMRRRNKQTNDETTDGSLLSATTALVFLNTCCSLTHLLKHLRPSSHMHSSNLSMFIVSQACVLPCEEISPDALKVVKSPYKPTPLSCTTLRQVRKRQSVQNSIIQMKKEKKK